MKPSLERVFRNGNNVKFRELDMSSTGFKQMVGIVQKEINLSNSRKRVNLNNLNKIYIREKN